MQLKKEVLEVNIFRTEVKVQTLIKVKEVRFIHVIIYIVVF